MSSLLLDPTTLPEIAVARIMDRVSLIQPDEQGCLRWEWSLRNGYGSFTVGRQTLSVHRFVLAMREGPLRRDQLALHDCDVKPCVNVDHLHVGSAKQNIREAIERGLWTPRSGNRHHLRQRTHCSYGHEYTEENTYLYRNKRYCRTCRRDVRRSRTQGNTEYEEQA